MNNDKKFAQAIFSGAIELPKKVEVVCEGDVTVGDLEHTCNNEEDAPCAACESLG